MADDPLPTRIGRYQIRRELSRGGMGVVYLAFDPNVEREVALKVLAMESLYDETARARFRREARVVAALEHPAIVPLYDFGEVYRRFYLVMRYLRGGSLAERLGRGRLAPQTVLPVLARVAEALDHAHSQGVVHRDLKPGNILFDERWQAYLGDFGIARITAASQALTGGRLTHASIPGTAAYMSPEQVQAAEELDGRSDVYSLGVVLFELLSGQLPFMAATQTALALQHVTTPAPGLREFEPELPPALEAVVAQALEKEPARRQGSAGELAAAFRRALEAAPQGEVAQPTGQTPAPVRPAAERPAPALQVCARCGYVLRNVSGACPICGAERRLDHPG